MTSNYLQKISKDTGMSIEKLEYYWKTAEDKALKNKNKTDEGFYGYVTTIFKKMLPESVKEDYASDLVDIFYDRVCEEGEASTQSADIAQPDQHMFGKPLFRVSKDMFMKIGCQQRGRKWYQSFYGTKVGEWAKLNKGKEFCIQDEDTGFIYDIPRDKHKKNEKEINLDEEKFRKS